MKNILSIALASFFLFGLSSLKTSEINHDGEWVHLGSKKVNWSIEKDVIKVGKHAGSFSKLKIKVLEGDVNMKKMMVTYENGKTENIPLKFYFKKGSESRIIDLKGKKRKIKEITFWYDTRNRSKKRATVHVAGKKV